MLLDAVFLMLRRPSKKYVTVVCVFGVKEGLKMQMTDFWLVPYFGRFVIASTKYNAAQMK